MRVEIRPMDILDKHYNIDETVNNLVDQELNLAKDNPVQNFLSGKNCLNGVSFLRRISETKSKNIQDLEFRFFRFFQNSI